MIRRSFSARAGNGMVIAVPQVRRQHWLRMLIGKRARGALPCSDARAERCISTAVHRR